MMVGDRTTGRAYLETEVLNGRKRWFWAGVLRVFLWGKSNRRTILLYRLGKRLYDAKYTRLSTLFFLKLEREYGVYISPNASIGLGLKFPHPTGIVIGDGVVIGDDVTIYQQVTIGGARPGDSQDNRYPEVCSGTIIFAGAKLLGKIRVGHSCIIGANAVVIKDVPDHCTATGVPANNTPKKTNAMEASQQ